ncbi:hypothetical protein Hanom_Chr12g01114311 [Helianthus anomalus]
MFSYSCVDVDSPQPSKVLQIYRNQNPLMKPTKITSGVDYLFVQVYLHYIMFNSPTSKNHDVWWPIFLMYDFPPKTLSFRGPTLILDVLKL